MNRLATCVAAIAALVIGAPVFAADMAVKAPPPAPAAVYSWTGWYVGGNVGYSWGNGDVSYDQPATAGTAVHVFMSGSQRLDGVIGGPQVGFNWRASNNFVVGLEADFQWSGEKGSTDLNFAYSLNGPQSVSGPFSSDLTWFGTVRGRAGWLVNPNTLLYATGGVAYGRIATSGALTNTLSQIAATCACGFWSFNQTTTKTGWTIGGGIEGTVPNTANWTWKIEYLYIDFGTISGNGVQVGFEGEPFPFTWSTKVTDNIVRVGLNYQLH